MINKAKFVFGEQDLDFIGHHLMSSGITPLAEKVCEVRQYKVPKTVKLLQRILGMLIFYPCFLPNAAAVLRPLTDVLAGVLRLSTTRRRALRLLACYMCTQADGMDRAFGEAKSLLAHVTILAHPHSTAQLHLRPDASRKAIVGMLHQVVDGQEQSLAFYSCHMTLAESRYSAYNLVLLAHEPFWPSRRLPDVPVR